MSKFIQIHMLTNYAPSNLNRDDLGRPKTAKMGGVDRLRISSQSLKRAWRTSDLFQNTLAGNIGTRTKKIGEEIYDFLLEKEVEESKALEVSIAVAGIFGKNEKKDKKKPLAELEIAQLSHITPMEIEAAKKLAVVKAEEESVEITKKEIEKLHSGASAVDIALFGRMLASAPKYNMEAAVQVSHALTVNKVVVEDDYFTAIDDLNSRQDDAGSAHIGESGFGSGIFYTYICINESLLVENLKDENLANRAIKALIEVAATVAPSGKQNSFASRARALYMLAEKGSQQPRQLSSAFLKPVDGVDMSAESISRIQDLCENMDKVYGKCADERKSFDVEKGQGTLLEILDFIGE